jgi:hypothetical protein
VEIAATAQNLLSQRGVKTSHSNNLQRSNDSQGSKCGTEQSLVFTHIADAALLCSVANRFL